MPSTPRAESASIEDAIRSTAADALLRIFTCLPGVVRGFDATATRARVQPLPDRMVSGEGQPHPIVLDVPVIYPAGGGYSVTFPLAEGDAVLLLFSQRGLSDFKDRLARNEGLERVRPDMNVYFRVQDAIAVPGFVSGAVRANTLDITVPTGGSVSINGRDVHDDTEEVGTADVNVVSSHQWVATGITMPEDANWYFINFGRGNAGAQRAGDWHRVLGSAFRALGAETAGTNITGQPDRAFLFERAHGNVDQFIGRTAANELLVTTSAGHVDALGLQVLRSNPYY